MTLRELEVKVAGWLRQVPHLPIGAQSWIASNIWWIALIGGTISAIVAFLVALGLIATLPLISFSVFFGSHGTWWVIQTIVSLAFIAITAIILIVAYQPLHRLVKKGWVLLFLLLLINTVWTVISALTAGSAWSVLQTLVAGGIFLAVEAYLLYEIRGYFSHPSKIEHSATQHHLSEK